MARGSSPLARGPLGVLRCERRATGLIPARAGTTHDNLAGGHVHGAHPRSRGDHLRVTPPVLTSTGSSPLARGPHACIKCRDKRRGLIPARAGTTPSFRCTVFQSGLIPARAGTTLEVRQNEPIRWAHPRSRGDHAAEDAGVHFELGSSPLARGPRVTAGMCRRRGGLIPARAGTTRRPA